MRIGWSATDISSPDGKHLVPKVRFGFESGHPSALKSCPLSASGYLGASG
jgi:hypothetical protein